MKAYPKTFPTTTNVIGLQSHLTFSSFFYFLLLLTEVDLRISSSRCCSIDAPSKTNTRVNSPILDIGAFRKPTANQLNHSHARHIVCSDEVEPSKISSSSFRCRDSVKHFPLTIDDGCYKFGMGTFKTMPDLVEHFANQPLIGSESGKYLTTEQQTSESGTLFQRTQNPNNFLNCFFKHCMVSFCFRCSNSFEISLPKECGGACRVLRYSESTCRVW
jgi:hypothetical protein